MPDWMIQTLFVAALGAIAWFLRGLRTDVDEIRIDLAKNYVTHDELRELKRDQRRTLALLTKLQMQLARRFNLAPLVDDEDDEN